MEGICVGVLFFIFQARAVYSGLVDVTQLAVCCMGSLAVDADRYCVHTGLALGVASVALVKPGRMWLCTYLASQTA
jgi:hypothetical protein